jgi:hypothetical protein
MSAIRGPLADRLLVHDHRSGTAVYGRIGPGVPLHYALDTGGSEALSGWITARSAAGIEATSIQDEAGSQARSLHDPDGQDIELVTAASRPSPGKTAGAR